jgi:hypothetical protein
MRKHTLIIVALASTLSACALEDQAFDDEAIEDEAIEDEAIEDEAPAAQASNDEAETSPEAASAPVCSGAAPPSGWVLDSAYGAPNACRKCQEAGLRLEASGRWRTRCMLLGGVGPALLFRFCVACLDAEADKPEANAL